eukprot:4713296-Amphidinium_carterae.1
MAKCRTQAEREEVHPRVRPQLRWVMRCRGIFRTSPLDRQRWQEWMAVAAVRSRICGPCPFLCSCRILCWSCCCRNGGWRVHPWGGHRQSTTWWQLRRMAKRSWKQEGRESA